MMPTSVNRYDEIVRTLRYIQCQGFKSAIVAGGAVRDIYLEKPPNDIDVFIWNPKHSGQEVFENYIRINKTSLWSLFRCNHRLGDDIRQLGNPDYSSKFIESVWDIQKGYLPYQVIVLKLDPVKYVEHNFDIGLCKAYFDGQKFRYTPDFMKDAMNKTLTICGHDFNQDEFDFVMKKHIPKLKKKFPGFTVQVAPHNLKFVDKRKHKL